MKLAAAAKAIVTLGVVAVSALVIRPDLVDKYLPGSGQRAIELREMMPKSIADRLPAYKTETQTAEGGARPAAQGAAGAPGGGRPGAGGPGAGGRPPVPINTEVATIGPMPYRLDAVGTVQAVASVAVKTRVDAQISEIMAPDGAMVKAGDVLVKLDSRQIEAQIRQTEATIAKDRVAVDTALRDIARFKELLSKGTGTQLNLDNAHAALNTANAQLAVDEAILQNQKVQLSWYTLTAPISGRTGVFNVKAGNIIRSGDNSATGTIATIVQTAPIYVAFAVPQLVLADLRAAVASGSAEVIVTPQGSKQTSKGRIALIDNTIDPATGSVMARAIFENADDLLWAGQLCNVRVTLRVDPNIVSIPRTATQAGQIGNYVYVIENNVARVRQIKVQRFQDGRDIISEGLKGGETVVTDGALQLVDGGRVNIKNSDTVKGAI